MNTPSPEALAAAHSIRPHTPLSVTELAVIIDDAIWARCCPLHTALVKVEAALPLFTEHQMTRMVKNPRYGVPSMWGPEPGDPDREPEYIEELIPSEDALLAHRLYHETVRPALALNRP